MSPAIRIRHPELKDCREFLARVRASRELHSPWVTPPSTTAQFTSYVERMQGPAHCGFLVCHAQTGAIAGVINISNIVLGVFRSGYLGYYAFAGFERQGLMREGLRRLL